MGHYASDMGYEGPKSAAARLKDQIKQDYGDRGYVGPAVKHYSDVIHADTYHDQPPLLHHTPCGGAVFDPDAHDKFCPAQK